MIDSLSAPRSQGQCLLLALPAELRNTIYSYILIQPTDLHEDRIPNIPISKPRPPTYPRRRFCANVLQTCKQINEEGSPILYGQNIFDAHASLLAEWPSLVLATSPKRTMLPPVRQPRPLSMIRRYHIFIRLDTDPRFDRKSLQKSFSHVEQLHIQVFQAMYGSCDFSVLELFEDIRGVGEARVLGSVGDGNYASWLEASMMRLPNLEIEPYTSTSREKGMAWSKLAQWEQMRSNGH